MFNLPPEIILFDTEYTTWEGAYESGWSGLGEFREIVQIGALKVDARTFTEGEGKIFFARPVKNPKLSDYFTRLTGITQSMVDREGKPYREVLCDFSVWAENVPLWCWGHDGQVMRENAELIGIPFPFIDERFGNMRDFFKAYGIPADQYMSSTIPRAFGEEPPPLAHDALNDARSILQGLRALARREGETKIPTL